MLTLQVARGLSANFCAVTITLNCEIKQYLTVMKLKKKKLKGLVVWKTPDYTQKNK